MLVLLVLVLVLVERLFKPGFSEFFGNQPKTARLEFFCLIRAEPAEHAEPAFELVLSTRTWFSGATFTGFGQFLLVCRTGAVRPGSDWRAVLSWR